MQSYFPKLAAVATLAIAGLAPSPQKPTEVPPKPLQLDAKAEYEGAVSIAVLTWREDADDELGFEVLRSQNNDEFKVVGITGANTTRYRDKVGRYISGAYRYRVRAFNEAGRGEPSDPVSVWF